MRLDVAPRPSLPPDFDDFWAMTLDELDDTEPDPQLLDIHHGEDPDLRLRRLRFTSLGDVRITGYLLTGPGPRPLMVHSHGYGNQTEVHWPWARRGANVLGIDIRGFGQSRDAVGPLSRWGKVLTGIESPETSLLRGAVCDYARAVRLGRELLGGQVTRVVSHGISFAGGLAVMAQGLLAAADVMTVGVPTFGWVDGRHFSVKVGSGAEISAYVSHRPEDAEDVALVLRYFDAVAFAAQITCPTLVGLGLRDDVVPAETVFAIANQLPGPHEVMIFPISHSDHPDEDLWAAFDDRCVQFAHHGVPEGFGADRRQLVTRADLDTGQTASGMGSAG